MSWFGGGWTLLVPVIHSNLASLAPGSQRYLYSDSKSAVRSPVNNIDWRWGSGQYDEVRGSYDWETSSGSKGSVSCPSGGESLSGVTGVHGIGCSTGSFASPKVICQGSNTPSSAQGPCYAWVTDALKDASSTSTGYSNAFIWVREQ